MINTNKRWLLTASPWMIRGHRSAPLAIKSIFLIALLMLSGIAGRAQVQGLMTAPSGGYMPVSGPSGTPALPLITGGTTICVNTTTLLSNTITGGSWSTSNAAVATVNSGTGVVTGVHGGVVTITYTVGISTISTTVTVTYPITGLSAVCVGNTINLTDTTTTGIWSSSNPAVATVSPYGIVTGVSAGTANIIFGRTGACTVTKTVNVGSNGVADINGTGTLAVCAGSTITATDATVGGTWSSSTPAVATVVSGTGDISGLAAGASTITYTSGGCFKTKTVVVTTLSAIANILPATPSVCIGSTSTLTDATPLGTWSSADLSKATINTGGIVTGLATGSVLISYSKGGCSRTTTLSVNSNTTGAITGNLSVCIGTPSTLSSSPALGTWTSSNALVATVGPTTGAVTGVTSGVANITYSQGGCIKVAMVTVNPSSSVGGISGTTAVCQGNSTVLADTIPGGTWASSDPTKATINAFGTVTGLTAGNVTITYTRLGCTRTTGFTVNPLPASITGIMNVCAGQTRPLSDVTGAGTWTSSNAAVATIDGTGLVTGVASGSVNISYTVAGCRVTTPFTVNGPAAISGGSIDCIAPLTYLYLSNSTLGGTWSSSNTLVATINATTGAVTGVSGGAVTMTYTQPSTGCYVTKDITVNYAPGNISGNFSTCAGATTTLADTMGGGVWTSANPGIATIGAATGIVSGLATGGALISYTANGCTKTVNVVVSPSVNVITGPGTVCAGWATIQLSDATAGGNWSTTSPYIYVSGTGLVTGGSVVTGMVTTGVVNYTIGGCTVSTTITVNPNPVGSTAGIPEVCKGSSTTLINGTTGGGTWSSQYPAVATVGSATGVVTGLSHGTSAITFTNAGGCFKTFIMSVNDTAQTITGSWKVCANGTTLLGGETGIPGGWSSSNSGVATIDATGLVTGVSTGTATITFARYGGCEAYHNITSVAPPAAIGGAGSVCMGGDVITATEATSPGTGTWTTSNGAVLTTSAGSGSPVTLNGISAGVAILTFTASAAGNSCFVTKTVSVNATAPAAITGSSNVCIAGVSQLANTQSGGSWSLSTIDKTKASVDGTGLVTGVALGSVNVTYSYIGCYVTKAVTVGAYTAGAVTGSNLVCVADATTLSNTVSGTWTSGNTAVATIDAGGVVTGVAAGSAAITFTDASNCTAFFTTVVTGSGSLPSITGTASMCKGLNSSLANSLSGGTWTSATPATATVIANTGYVTGVAAGNSVISYSVPGCLNFPVTTIVTVLATPAAMGGLTGSPTPNILKVCEAASKNLSETSAGGTWTIADISVATISGSTGTPISVTGQAAGLTYATYTLPDGCFVTGQISVGHPPAAITGSPVCVGQFVTFSDATPGGTWSSSDTTAIVDATFGIVSGFSPGTPTINYTTPGCTAVTYPITVNAAPGAIGGLSSICKTFSTTLTDTTTGGTWASSDVTLATIGSSSGILLGVAGGNPTISYTAPNGCVVTELFYVDPCGLKFANGAPVSAATVQSYTLFPNPNSGSMHITQAIPVDGTMQVSVLSTVGAKVYSGTIDFAGGNGQLSCNVSPGIYLVLLQDAGGIAQTFKIMVE